MITDLELITSVYSIFIGISIMGLWIMLILTKQVPELKTDPVEIYFHTSAEFMMGILSLISGALILLEIDFGLYLFLISSGLCIYSVTNSAGYYAQRKKWLFIGLFAFIFAASFILSTLLILSFF